MKQRPFFYVFALVLLFLYGGYFWSAYSGYRWLGDDDQSAAVRHGYRSGMIHRSGTSHFFHK